MSSVKEFSPERGITISPTSERQFAESLHHIIKPMTGRIEVQETRKPGTHIAWPQAGQHFLASGLRNGESQQKPLIYLNIGYQNRN